jgi:tetratricopeptide (TPR) repeat protein
MDIHPIAKLIVNKGIENYDVSMFTEEQKKEILAQAANIFMRQGKFTEAVICMEKAGLPLPKEQIRMVADKKILMGQYQEAYELLSKTGLIEMAEFVKANFL